MPIIYLQHSKLPTQLMKCPALLYPDSKGMAFSISPIPLFSPDSYQNLQPVYLLSSSLKNDSLFLRMKDLQIVPSITTVSI